MRKPKRVFFWSFWAVQALFLIWVVAGSQTHTHGSAEAAGKGLGVTIIVVLWLIVDAILGISRLIVLLTRKNKV